MLEFRGVILSHNANVISTNLACNMCVHDQAKSSYHVYAHKSLKFKNIFKTYRWGLYFFEVFIMGNVGRLDRYIYFNAAIKDDT